MTGVTVALRFREIPENFSFFPGLVRYVWCDMLNIVESL